MWAAARTRPGNLWAPSRHPPTGPDKRSPRAGGKARPARGPKPPREHSPAPLPTALSPYRPPPPRPAGRAEPTVACGPDFEFTGPAPALPAPIGQRRSRGDAGARRPSWGARRRGPRHLRPQRLAASPPLRPPPPARGSAPPERKQSAAGGRLGGGGGGGGARTLLGSPGHPHPVFPERVCARV